MIGDFAYSKAGRDKGKLYVIVGEADDFVLLSDGRYKPIYSPKRKKKKHIQLIHRTVSASLEEALKASEPVRDEAIKLEIKRYKSCQDQDGTICHENQEG